MKINVDNVLVSLGMGRYQYLSVMLFGFMILYTNVTSVMYIFTAGDLKYRCEIPECDSKAEQIYEQDWLRFTTPYKSDMERPQKCERYATQMAGSYSSVNATRSRCVASNFDKNKTEYCHGRWVFEDHENTIATEFGIMCEENKWKLSMVGSLHNLGQFIGIPISGIVADKFGRKFTMIVGAVIAATTFTIQSFSISYPMFLFLEILSSIVFSGVYSATFVLAMELVLPDKRIIYCSIMECFNPLGGMVVALVASQVKDWKLLLQICHIPALLFFTYFWLTEESMKWLETQGKHDKVIDVLTKISTVNNKPLPDLSLNTQTEQTEGKDNENENDKKLDTNIFKIILHSPKLIWRMIKCSFVWIAVTLVYYGLNISATDIAGNKYLNFMLVSFVEIPACLVSWMIMEKMSRKMSLACMFLLSGATCIMYNITLNSFGFVIKLSLFMISKLAISVAFVIIYIMTAEIFPTSIRTTMLSFCSMIGRIGSMLAPQITLLVEYFGWYMPMLIMGTTALVAAAITMSLPESKNIELPDTVIEAERIGDDLPMKNIEN